MRAWVDGEFFAEGRAEFRDDVFEKDIVPILGPEDLEREMSVNAGCGIHGDTRDARGRRQWIHVEARSRAICRYTRVFTVSRHAHECE